MRRRPHAPRRRLSLRLSNGTARILRARADDRRAPQIPRPRRDRPVRPERSREPRQQHDRPMDQRTRREAIPQQIVGLSLREEERKVLAEVGRFRVITTRDLAETVYGQPALPHGAGPYVPSGEGIGTGRCGQRPAATVAAAKWSASRWSRSRELGAM